MLENEILGLSLLCFDLLKPSMALKSKHGILSFSLPCLPLPLFVKHFPESFNLICEKDKNVAKPSLSEQTIIFY